MFEAKLTEKDKVAAQDQPVQDFLQLWGALKGEFKDKIRLGKLELKVDKAWAALSQEHKDVAWMICFPGHRRIKETLGAHVTSLGKPGLLDKDNWGGEENGILS